MVIPLKIKSVNVTIGKHFYFFVLYLEEFRIELVRNSFLVVNCDIDYGVVHGSDYYPFKSCSEALAFMLAKGPQPMVSFLKYTIKILST